MAEVLVEGQPKDSLRRVPEAGQLVRNDHLVDDRRRVRVSRDADQGLVDSPMLSLGTSEVTERRRK